MALSLDQCARKALARRTAHRGGTIYVRAGGVPLRGRLSSITAGWMSGACPAHLVPVRCGDATIYADPRIARYATWHPITVTARRFGPLVQVDVVDALVVEERLRIWELTHPDLRRADARIIAA